MAGEVNFSGKLAKSIDLSAITVENLDETKKKEIEKIFNTVTGGNSANTLTTDELVVLSDADKNHDGKITDEEAKAAYDKLADNVKQGLTEKQVTQNDYVAYLKAMAKKNEELIAQENNVGNDYTVQLGEDLDDLVDRIVEANKIPEADKAAAKERYKAAIIAANKNNGAIKFDGNGNVKWLVAGAKIILPTMTQDGRADKRVKDQNNKTAVENKYRAWRAGKIQSFRYSINADGQASEVRSSGSTNFDVTKDYDPSTGEQEGVQPLEIDDSKISETDDAKKAKIKERLDDANTVLQSFADNSSEVTTENGTGKIGDVEYNKKTIKYDGKEIVVFYDKSSGEIKEIWLDADGQTSSNGNNKYEISIKADGSTTVYRENNDPSTKSTTEAGTFDFEKVKELVKKFAGEKFDSTADEASDEQVSELPYNINHYETEGTELGEMLYNQVKGSSGNATTRRFLKQIDEKNVSGVVAKFNSLSSDEHIIKYLVNESGIKNEDIAHVIDSIIKCAEDYKLKDTDEYADLKGYKTQIDNKKSSDPSDVDWAEEVDKAVESLLTLIKKTANEKGADYKVSDITAPDKFLRSNKISGRDVGLRLYNEVHGSSSTEDTRKILRDIKDYNVYYVIERFNEKSPDENIIKYLVNESNITYGNLTCVIGNALLCAKQYGLENTKEYRDVKAYQNFCYNAENKNIDPDDEDWADRVDTALKALMTKVNERAASRGENLL